MKTTFSFIRLFFVLLVSVVCLHCSAEEKQPGVLLVAMRKLMEQEQWDEAIAKSKGINRHKSGYDRAEKAETGYRLGLCHEKLGEPEMAERVYLSVIATFAKQEEWALKSLERFFELRYQVDDPDEKRKAYQFLEKFLMRLEDAEDPPGVRDKLEVRRFEVARELGLKVE